MPKFEVKKHLLTAISFFLPVVCAAGFLLAIGNIMGGQTIDDFQAGFTFADTMTTMGGYGMSLIAVIVSTAIAYSIADKPGIAPGVIIGVVAFATGSGFLGGILSGFICGYLVVCLITYIEVPKWMQGLMPTLVIPFISTLVAGLIMYYIVGTPVVWLMDGIVYILSNLNPEALVVTGMVIGIFSSIDYGGPINKTVFAFVFTLYAEGIYEPITVLILASMVTPFGLAMAHFIGKAVHKRIFTKQEVEVLKTAVPMGVCQITEGCFPIVLNDLGRCMIATGIGGAIGGGLSMLWGADSHIPASGMLAIPTMEHPLAFIAALFIGSLATAIAILILKKPVNENDSIEQSIEDEDEIDFADLKIS